MGTIKLDIAVGLLSKLGPGLTNLKAELKQALSKLDVNVQDSKKIMSAFGVDPKNTAKSLQEIVTLFKTAKNDIFNETRKLTNADALGLGFVSDGKSTSKNLLMKSLKVMFDEAFTGLSAGMPARFDKAFSKLGNLQQPTAIKKLIDSIKTDLDLAVKSSLIDKKTSSGYNSKLNAESARLQAKLDAKAYNTAWAQAILEDKKLTKMSSDERAAYREKGKREAKAYNDAWAEALSTNGNRTALEKKAAQQTIQLSKEVADKTKGYATEATRASTQAMSSGVRATALAADQAANKVKATLSEIKALQSKQGVALKLGDFKEIDALAAKITNHAARAKRELGQVWTHAGAQVPAFSKKFEDAMTALSYRFTHVGFQFTIFSSMALNAFRAPLAAALEFDRELGFIRAIAKSSALSFDNLRDSILQMGTNSIYSVQKIAEGVRTLAQAGFDSAQAMQAVPAVLNFAASGMVSLDEAAKIAFNTMTIFSGPQGMQDLPRLLSEFAAAANKSNTDVKGMGTAMKSAAPIARQLGYTASETMAILGQLSKGGLGESLAGTSLRNMLQRLLTTTPATTKALKALGLTLKDFENPETKEFAKMPEVIDKFNAALDKLNPVEKAEAISNIFRTRGAAGFLVLLQQGSAGLRQMQKEIETSGDNALIAAERADTLWGSFERMKNAVGALTAELGTSIVTSLGPFSEALRIMASAMVTALQSSAALRGLVGVSALVVGLTAVVAAGAGAFTLLASAVTSAMGAFPGLIRLLRGTRIEKVASIVITDQMTKAEIENALATQAAAKAQVALQAATKGASAGALTLASSWKAATLAMKAFAAVSIILSTIEIGKALIEGWKAFSDISEQSDNAARGVEKFKEALSKPILTADKFELLSEEEKRKEIQRLSQIERVYYETIRGIEAEIARKELLGFLTFGIFGNTKDLKTRLDAEKKKLAEAFKAESWTTLNPKKSKVWEDTADDVDGAIGTIRKLGDILTEQIAEIDLLGDAYGTLAEAAHKSAANQARYMGDAAASVTKVYEDNLHTLKRSYTSTEYAQALRASTKAALETHRQLEALSYRTAKVNNSAFREDLRLAGSLKDAKIKMSMAFFKESVDLIAKYAKVDVEQGKKILEERRGVTKSTLISLKTMWAEAIKAAAGYAKAVADQEANIQQTRLEGIKTLQGLNAAPTELTSPAAKIKASQDEIISLNLRYQELLNDGSEAALKEAEVVNKRRIELNSEIINNFKAALVEAFKIRGDANATSQQKIAAESLIKDAEKYTEIGKAAIQAAKDTEEYNKKTPREKNVLAIDAVAEAYRGVGQAVADASTLEETKLARLKESQAANLLYLDKLKTKITEVRVEWAKLAVESGLDPEAIKKITDELAAITEGVTSATEAAKGFGQALGEADKKASSIKKTTVAGFSPGNLADGTPTFGPTLIDSFSNAEQVPATGVDVKINPVVNPAAIQSAVAPLGTAAAKDVSEKVTPAIVASLSGPEVMAASTDTANELGLAVSAALITGFEDAKKSWAALDSWVQAPFKGLGDDILSIWGTVVTEMVSMLTAAFNNMGSFLKGMLGFKVGVSPAVADKKATGGTIFGSGNSDTVPILAQPGEFMLSRKMVSLFGGLNILEAIRNKVMGGTHTKLSFGMPALATGGAIGGRALAGSYALDLNLITGSGSTRAKLYGEKEVIESVINALKRESLTQR